MIGNKVFNKLQINNKRIIYLDILNILACISIIALHCNGIVHNYLNIRAWKTSLIVETMCYWAVPIFLMITGANLMNYRKKYDTKTFFNKRLTKILIPFIFWVIVTIILKYFAGTLVINEFSVKNILNIIFTNKEQSIYYFIFIILGVYLTLPIISHLAEDKYRNTLWYAVTVMFIIKSLLSVIFTRFKILYDYNLSIMLGDYLIFVFLGYLLSTQSISKRNRIIIYILSILSLLFRYGFTFYWSTKNQHIDKTLFSYIQFHSVILATGVFILVKNINFDKFIKSEKTKKVISKISSCSFGIYLIHKLIFDFEYKLFNIDIYSWQWRTLGVIGTYVICLILVYIIKKIPILNKVVP